MPNGETDSKSELQALIGQGIAKKDEARVLSLFMDVDDAALNDIVATVDLKALIRSVKQHLFGQKNRATLLHILTRQRVGCLGPAEKALLATALQKGRTDSLDEAAIVDLFLATSGLELTELKNRVDAGVDHRDMVQLVYSDIDDRELRQKLRDHISSQSPPLQNGRRKVLSDIDDTFYANWKDSRYPKKTVYPGVTEFYRALTASEQTAREQTSGAVTFITARPSERSGVLEKMAHRSLRKRGLESVTVLTGSLGAIHSNTAIAEKKLRNFNKYVELFPEYYFVFIGDSGQGDVRLATQMRQSQPALVEATFIHDVVAMPEERRDELWSQGVYVFDTYAGAALLAYELGLFDGPSLAMVAEACKREFATIEFELEQQKESRHQELERDLERIAQVI